MLDAQSSGFLGCRVWRASAQLQLVFILRVFFTQLGVRSNRSVGMGLKVSHQLERIRRHNSSSQGICPSPTRSSCGAGSWVMISNESFQSSSNAVLILKILKKPLYSESYGSKTSLLTPWTFIRWVNDKCWRTDINSW